MTYITLFFVALISGSLFPLGSEGVLIYDLKQGYNAYLLLGVATVGNTLGGAINYFLGLKGEEFLEKRGYLNPEKTAIAKTRFKKYGSYALLLSPLPIVGDPITFIAGIFEYNFKKFIAIVAFAKAVRYLIVYLLLV